MAKFLAAIAVLAVTGGVCDAATYNPLQNPGRGQCMNVCDRANRDYCFALVCITCCKCRLSEVMQSLR